ncbi:unnamed protein product [Sympodiomycopsis kandeliae]
MKQTGRSRESEKSPPSSDLASSRNAHASPSTNRSPSQNQQPTQGAMSQHSRKQQTQSGHGSSDSSLSSSSLPSSPTSYKGKERQQGADSGGSLDASTLSPSSPSNALKRAATTENSSTKSPGANSRKAARTTAASASAPSSSTSTLPSASIGNRRSQSPPSPRGSNNRSPSHSPTSTSPRSSPSATGSPKSSPSRSLHDAGGRTSPSDPAGNAASNMRAAKTSSASPSSSSSLSNQNATRRNSSGTQQASPSRKRPAVGSSPNRLANSVPVAPISPSERSDEDIPSSPETELPAFFEGTFVEEMGGGNSSVDSDAEERDVVINDSNGQFTLRVPQPLLLTSTIARGAYHQCGTARRVKVYELSGETWEDRGTGYCAGVYDEGQDEALLVARLEEHSIKLEGAMPDPRRPANRLDPLLPVGSEGDPDGDANADRGPFPYFLIVSQDLSTDAIMLKSRVVKEDVYQKQQETLVVWTEPDGTDMALSFQEAEGCMEVWEFIIEVQKHFHMNSSGPPDVLSDPPTPEPGSPSSGEFGVSALGMGGIMMTDPSNLNLPEPSLATVERIDVILKNVASKNGQLRERVAEWLARSDFIRKLVSVFQDAEDLENLEALHRLCSTMQTIVMMNDSMIIETILQDDIFFDVVGMFEYDPEFPQLKASYRDYLRNTAKYKQVVPIEDPKVVIKIHQAYRLQYLKDVILARILDDAMFSVLNSWIFFHQVDIVNYCTSNPAFLPRLFAICAPDNDASQELKHEAVFLLQHLCSIGKQIQLPARITLCKTLAEKGLLPVVEYALFEQAPKVQNAAAEMLMVLVEYDPNSIRNYVLDNAGEKKSTLVTKVATLLHSTEDLGLKAQMADALRILFDNSGETVPPNASLAAAAAAARTKAEPDKFLNWFYEAEVDYLFSPLKRLQRVGELESSALLDLSPRHHSALLGHLCDLLCYTIAQHTFRSQYYVITSEIGTHVGSLLHAKEKHMRLAAIKFFRTCLSTNNQFMTRHFAKHGIFDSLLALLQRESTRDNLVLSACLEFFVSVNVQPSLKSHLISEPQRTRVISLASNKFTGKCFSNLLSQSDGGADQSISSTSGPDTSSASHQSIDLHALEEEKRRERDLLARGIRQSSSDDEDDQYFNEIDDNDDHGVGPQENAGRSSGSQAPHHQRLPRSKTSSALVPYGDDDNQSDDSISSSTSSSEDVSNAGTEAAVDEALFKPKTKFAAAKEEEEDLENSGGFFRQHENNNEMVGSGASSSIGSSGHGVKRPGEPLTKNSHSVKKISLGLSKSSKKMAAAQSQDEREEVEGDE